MSEAKINALYLGCGDPRLWETHTHKRKELITSRGLKLYNLLVPGPDKGAQGNERHHDAEAFFCSYFHDLTGFEELHYLVHEDCAGCNASPLEHSKLAWVEAKALAKERSFTGKIFVYISRIPTDDEYGIWPTEEIPEPENLLAA